MSESQDSASPVTLSAAPPMGTKLGSQLSIMMFLQYAIWGAWLPILWPFLAGHRGFAPGEIGTMFAMGAIGAIVAPFIAGQIADRYFNTEKFLGLSHILGGILVWFLADITTFAGFLLFSLAYSLVYSPTLSLTNSLAFHHLPDRDRDFGRVRVWGTIGWICAGIAVGQWLSHHYDMQPSDAAAALVDEHVMDKDGRKHFSETVSIKLKGEKGKAYKGSIYEQTESVIVLNTSTDPAVKALVAVKVADIDTNKPLIELSIRPGLLPEVKQAIADLDAGKDPKAVRESLLKHSEYTVVSVRGGEVELNADAFIQLKAGGDVTGTLLAKTDKVFVIEQAGAKELTVILSDQVAKARKANGDPIIGKIDKDKADAFPLTIATDEGAKSVAKEDYAGREMYSVFTADAVAAKINSVFDAGRADAFKLSAVLGIIMGVFCFMLPTTPPSPGKQSSATGEAMGEIRKQPLLTLFLLAVPISCIHQFYFVHTAGFLTAYQNKAEGFMSVMNTIFGKGGGGFMTIGQISEIAVLAFIPLVAKRWTRKTLLSLGIIAYALRMFLFAYADVLPVPAVFTIILGVAMHGFCFGCFIFVAFMVVDEETTGDVRASAQSLFNLVIVGVGIIVGSKFAGWVYDASLDPDGKVIYSALFSVPMWIAVGCLLFLLAFYPAKRKAVAA